MSNERRKRQKLDKKNKARKQGLAKARQYRPLAERSPREIVRAAASRPSGPSYVSHGHDDLRQPALVSVVVTRQLADGRLLPGLVLVDRTCLGVKSAFALRPVSEQQLATFLRQASAPHGGPMQPCELLYAQSIVYHALDFARALGFSPDPDFPEPLFGPRPAVLLDTPWARPSKPLYVSGPNDDVNSILGKLNRAVGVGNFGFTLGDPMSWTLDEDDEEEAIDAEGEEAP